MCSFWQLNHFDLSEEKWEEYSKSCMNFIVMNPAKVRNTASQYLKPKRYDLYLYADQLSLFSFHSTNCPEDARPLSRKG